MMMKFEILIAKYENERNRMVLTVRYTAVWQHAIKLIHRSN